MQQTRQIVTRKPAAISTQPLSSPVGEVLISGELLKLAEARQAAITDATLEVYTETLRVYRLEHIRAACMALRKRGDYETAFPDLETVEAAVKQAERDARPKFVPCEKCDGMGMIVKRREDGRFVAVDCECMKAWRRGCESAQPQDVKMNAAGQ